MRLGVFVSNGNALRISEHKRYLYNFKLSKTIKKFNNGRTITKLLINIRCSVVHSYKGAKQGNKCQEINAMEAVNFTRKRRIAAPKNCICLIY